MPEKIKRKVISKAPLKKEEVSEQSEVTPRDVRVKKGCYFCQNKIDPSYTDIAGLRKFISDRAKILPKSKNNLCSKHQRRMTRHIKYARILSLLPFTPKI